MRHSQERQQVWISAVLSRIRAAGEGDQGPPDHLPRTGLALKPEAVPHVLIVEDELFVAWSLEAIVQELGYVVCGIAARGEDAVQKAWELEPDLVLVDINLGGGIDGIEAARRIREDAPIPIVFVTAYGDGNTLAQISTAIPGAPVLDKPVTSRSLRLALKSALDRPQGGGAEEET